MGKITAINPQRRPRRYNVMVDDTFAIAVSEKVLVDLKLTIGKEMDQARLIEIASAEDASKALASALRLLEVRARSESEIRSRLISHGYPETTISVVVSKLHGYGFINDEQFAAAWIDSRSRTMPGGKYKLKSELHQKGIDKDTIDDAISQITEDTEIELARQALNKRPAVDLHNIDARRASYIRDAGFLARRGFSWTIARPVLNEKYGAVDQEEER
jgi:regulatory protein